MSRSLSYDLESQKIEVTPTLKSSGSGELQWSICKADV